MAILEKCKQKGDSKITELDEGDTYAKELALWRARLDAWQVIFDAWQVDCACWCTRPRSPRPPGGRRLIRLLQRNAAYELASTM